MKITTLIAFLLSGAVFSATALADSATQTINLKVQEIALLAIDGSDVSLDVVAPNAPGGAPAKASDSGTRLRYTSVVAKGQSRSIQAMVSGGSVPSGTELRVTANAAGKSRGAGKGAVTLSTNNQDIIGGIGSTATGSGSNRAELTYDLVVVDAENLAVTTPNLEVTFTLTAAN